MAGDMSVIYSVQLELYCIQWGVKIYIVMFADTHLIESRYDAIAELLENVEMFSVLESALKRFPDIETLITICTYIPR